MAEQSVILLYWFAIYVGIFGVMLMTQGLLTSFARIAAAKTKKREEEATEDQPLVDNEHDQQQQTVSIAIDKAENLIEIRSRAHGNNQEWAPLYCIMLLSLVWCDVAPWVFHVLAWLYLLIRCAYWYVSVRRFTWKRSAIAASHYLIYVVCACTAIGYGINNLVQLM